MNQIKYFLDGYRVPMSATVVFVLIVLALLMFRAYDRSVIAEILSGTDSSGKSYATLLSKDKTDSFNKTAYNVEEQVNPTISRPTKTEKHSSSSSSFTITSPDESTTSPPLTGGGTPPTPIFMAKVIGLRKENVSPVDCGSPPILVPSQCKRRYFFTADVATYNGPGTVNYVWRFSVPGSDDDSFSAGSGQSLTSIHEEVVISCATPPGPFVVQLSITSPNQTASDMLSVMHDCGDNRYLPPVNP